MPFLSRQGLFGSGFGLDALDAVAGQLVAVTGAIVALVAVVLIVSVV